MLLSNTALLSRYPIISDQIKRPALEVVLAAFEKTLQTGVGGDVVEFGCFIGTTSLFVRRLLDVYGSTAQFHVYDSFAGLPAKTSADMTPVGDDFKAGELSVSKKQLLAEFHKAGLQPPMIHKAWFNALTDSDVPQKISFAFLDGDFYQSIRDSLKLVWPRLSPGGIICIDDYKREALPGVERAVTEFFSGKAVKISVSHNIGIIKPA